MTGVQTCALPISGISGQSLANAATGPGNNLHNPGWRAGVMQGLHPTNARQRRPRVWIENHRVAARDSRAELVSDEVQRDRKGVV